MSNSYYKLYINKVMELVKTIVIKSDITALAINNSLQELGYVIDSLQPETWKYYMNLAGEYHPTDQEMKVISVDTLEEIVFNKANLVHHRGTAREYRYGNHYYKELLERYPEQEMLILGILNPVDKDVAIEAEDSTILWYDENLIEDNEVSFIYKLQDWVSAFKLRWDQSSYNSVDDLYAASFLGVMFVHMPKAILNIRRSFCKTTEAHSFHIREYLASHGRLDRYMPYLTKSQALFLYRNIRYIYNNVGKQDTFYLLMEHILTKRGFPLAEYRLRHNLGSMPNNLLPDIELVRENLNLTSSDSASDIYSVLKVLEKELPMAPNNYDVLYESRDLIIEETQNSLINEYPTKVLESKVVDRTDSVPFTFAEVQLNHWLYLSCTGDYRTVLSLDDPITGDRFPMKVKDAFVMFLYCYNKSIGMELEHVPNLDAARVVRLPYPTEAELKSIVQSKYVDQSLVDIARSYQTTVKSYVSTEAFYDLCVEIHENMLLHRDLYMHREHMVVRGQVQAMCDQFYCDRHCNLADEITYSEWFRQRGLKTEELSALECDILANNILDVATGNNLKKTLSLADIHKAMLELMSQLSSYSVQYIQNINTSPIVVPDSVSCRLGDHKLKAHAQMYPSTSSIKVTDIKAQARIKEEFTPSEFGTEMDVSIVPRTRIRVNTSSDVSFKGTEQTIKVKVKSSNIYVTDLRINDAESQT